MEKKETAIKLMMILCLSFLLIFLLISRASSLSITSDQTVSMNSVALDGSDQTSSGTLSTLTAANDGSDGWHVDIVSTDFFKNDDATKTISSVGFSIPTAPVVTVISGNTPPTSSALNILGGVGGKLLSALAGDGIGTYSVTPSLRLNVPAETYSGTFTATVTSTIVTGP